MSRRAGRLLLRSGSRRLFTPVGTRQINTSLLFPGIVAAVLVTPALVDVLALAGAKGEFVTPVAGRKSGNALEATISIYAVLMVSKQAVVYVISALIDVDAEPVGGSPVAVLAGRDGITDEGAFDIPAGVATLGAVVTAKETLVNVSTAFRLWVVEPPGIAECDTVIASRQVYASLVFPAAGTLAAFVHVKALPRHIVALITRVAWSRDVADVGPVRIHADV